MSKVAFASDVVRKSKRTKELQEIYCSDILVRIRLFRWCHQWMTPNVSVMVTSLGFKQLKADLKWLKSIWLVESLCLNSVCRPNDFGCLSHSMTFNVNSSYKKLQQSQLKVRISLIFFEFLRLLIISFCWKFLTVFVADFFILSLQTCYVGHKFSIPKINLQSAKLNDIVNLFRNIFFTFLNVVTAIK